MSDGILKHTTQKAKLTEAKLANLNNDAIIFIDDTKQIITKANGSQFFKTIGKGDICNFVLGTQTNSTNNFTGTIQVYKEDIVDGFAIDYMLPFDGTTTGATLKLSCIDGDFTAKNVYLGSTQVTNELSVNTIIHMIYRKSGSIDGWYVEDIHEIASATDVETIFNSVFSPSEE